MIDRSSPRANGFRAVRRQMLIFSMIGLLVMLIVLAIFDPMALSSARSAAEHLLAQQRTSSADIGWSMAPGLTLAGLFAGFLTGLLGMGGGVFKILFMLLVFRLDIFFARAVSLVTMFFSSASALAYFARRRLILWSFTGPMLALAVPGALIGVLLGNSLRGSTLTHIFGIFVFFLAFNTLALLIGDPNERKMTAAFNAQAAPYQGYQSGLIGGIHGVICGLLGVSGGVISTPMQQILLHVPTRQAIANTLVVSVAVTLLSSIWVVWSGCAQGDFTFGQICFVDLFMGTGVALGAPLGARLGERCNVSVLRLLFASTTFTAAIAVVF